MCIGELFLLTSPLFYTQYIASKQSSPSTVLVLKKRTLSIKNDTLYQKSYSRNVFLTPYRLTWVNFAGRKIILTNLKHFIYGKNQKFTIGRTIYLVSTTPRKASGPIMPVYIYYLNIHQYLVLHQVTDQCEEM